jgi:CBS domain-containing protein
MCACDQKLTSYFREFPRTSCGTFPINWTNRFNQRRIFSVFSGMFVAACLSVVLQKAGGAGGRGFSAGGDLMMEVKEIMTPDATAIWLTGSLADAAKLMWENDCGVLPVIKDGRKVIGMITDRDICMAAAMRDSHPSAISVEEVMTGDVYAVKPEDSIDQALQTMQEYQIRRLPVISPDGELEGILSMNDIVLNAKASDGAAGDRIDYRDIVKTCQAICQHRVPAAASSVASA